MISESLERIRERFDAVVFDLDGTLVDTAPDILGYLNEMLAELGRPGLDLATVRPMIGDGVRRLLIEGLEASGGVPAGIDMDALFHRYLDRYTANPARESRLFDGMRDVIHTLRAARIAVGVCTNKPQAPTERLLEALDMDGDFSAVIGGDALPVKKPDPGHLLSVLQRLDADPGRAVLIGDSATDLKTARAAHLPCILVSFGYTSIPASSLDPDALIDHASDLIPALADLIPTRPTPNRLTAPTAAAYSLTNKGD